MASDAATSPSGEETTTDGAAAAAATKTAAQDNSDYDDVRAMKIKDLKAELRSRGVPIDGLFEKDDLVKELVEARRKDEHDVATAAAGGAETDEGGGSDVEAPEATPEDRESARRRESIMESVKRRLDEFATSFEADGAAAAAAAAAAEEGEEEEEEEEEGWPTGFFTNLAPEPSRKKHRWERNAKRPVSAPLMERLLKNPNFSRATADDTARKKEGEDLSPSAPKSKAAEAMKETVAAPGRWIKKGVKGLAGAAHIASREEKSVAPTAAGNDDVAKKVGAGRSEEKGDKGKGMTIRPSFDLIGVDAFKLVPLEEGGKGPKAVICKEDLIIRAGLRDRPTFVVNLILPFGNVVLYYQMPDWVTSFRNIEEKESDPPDVKALKRFLSGDANYRMQRLQAYMSVASAPLALRPVASPKREITLLMGALPLRWRQGCAKYGGVSGGKKVTTKHAILEVDVDLSTDPDARKLAGVADQFMKMCAIDVALVVGELSPEWDVPGHENDGVDKSKPSACLGLARLDRINMAKAALIPES